MSTEFTVAMLEGIAHAGLGKTWAADARLTGPTTNCTVFVNNVLRHVYLDVDWDDPDIHADMMVRAEAPWSALDRAIDLGIAEYVVPSAAPAGAWVWDQTWLDPQPGRPIDGHQRLRHIDDDGAGYWQYESRRSSHRWTAYRSGPPTVPGRVQRMVVLRPFEWGGVPWRLGWGG